MGKKTGLVQIFPRGKKLTGQFFPRGKNGPAHSFPGKKLTGEKTDRYTGTGYTPHDLVRDVSAFSKTQYIIRITLTVDFGQYKKQVGV